jgi:hypothetical protein
LAIIVLDVEFVVGKEKEGFKRDILVEIWIRETFVAFLFLNKFYMYYLCHTDLLIFLSTVSVYTKEVFMQNTFLCEYITLKQSSTKVNCLILPLLIFCLMFSVIVVELMVVLVPSQFYVMRALYLQTGDEGVDMKDNAEDEEVIRLLEQLQELRSLRAKEQRKISELEEQLAGLLQV